MDAELTKLNDFYKKAMELAAVWGLKPFEIDFHVVPGHKIYEVASYGIPGHFSHWSYGKDYWKSKASYDKGHGRIYELVVNNDPAQAFLLDTNTLLDNMFVISHVIGHSSFFANNAYFAHTNRNMIQAAESTAERFREYEIKYGRDVVEDFISDVLTINEHIDPHLKIKDTPENYQVKYATDPYDDLHPEETARQEEWLKFVEDHKENTFPPEPVKDLLYFIANYNHKLKPWQVDIIMSIRAEMIFFLPQYQTKIMNEGWASLIHNKFMHILDPDIDPGGIDFADIHSAVLSPSFGQLNPYWLGYNMYKRIIQVEDKKEDDLTWAGAPNSDGWLKALEIMQIERDESFIRNYLDEQLCERLNLFTFEFDPEDRTWWVSQKKEWEKVRDSLVQQRANMGFPYIEVTDSDYSGNGSLLLQHKYDNKPLDRKWCTKTLEAVSRLWGKGVVLISDKTVYTLINGTITIDD